MVLHSEVGGQGRGRALSSPSMSKAWLPALARETVHYLALPPHLSGLTFLPHSAHPSWPFLGVARGNSSTFLVSSTQVVLGLPHSAPLPCSGLRFPTAFDARARGISSLCTVPPRAQPLRKWEQKIPFAGADYSSSCWATLLHSGKRWAPVLPQEGPCSPQSTLGPFQVYSQVE